MSRRYIKIEKPKDIPHLTGIFTELRDQIYRSEIETGDSLRVIAQRLGVTEQNVFHHKKKLGFTGRQPKKANGLAIWKK